MSPARRYDHANATGGTVVLGNGILRYDDDQSPDPVWQVPLSRVIMIVEQTLPLGPSIWDYCVHFVESMDVMYSCPASSVSFEELANHYDLPELSFKLSSSVEWATNIVWPPEMAGHEFWVAVPPKTRWERFKAWLCIGGEAVLTPEVVAYLAARGKGCPSQERQPD